MFEKYTVNDQYCFAMYNILKLYFNSPNTDPDTVYNSSLR